MPGETSPLSQLITTNIFKMATAAILNVDAMLTTG